MSAELFSAIAEKNVGVDMIIQNVARGGEGRADVTFTVSKTDLPRIRSSQCQQAR